MRTFLVIWMAVRLARLRIAFTPYRLLTPTVGLVEQVRLLRGSPEPIIAWRWWAFLPFVKLVARHWAVPAAVELFERESECLKEPESDDAGPRVTWAWEEREAVEEAPQAFAVRVAGVVGYGTPDEWRRVRLRDAVYLMDFVLWRRAREAGATDEPVPVWGGRR